MNLLFFDLETGGTNPKKNPILTGYFAVLDEKMNLIDELEIFTKPDKDGDYEIEDEALEVTQINLEEHLRDSRTVTISEAGKVLKDFLEKHKIKGKRRHFRPCGQNIGFDIDFITHQLMEPEEWGKLVHYRTLDTLTILTFLQFINFIPSELGNLESQVQYFNLPMGEVHNAKADVKMTIEVFKKYVSILKDKKKDFAFSINDDLLAIIEE